MLKTISMFEMWFKPIRFKDVLEDDTTSANRVLMICKPHACLPKNIKHKWIHVQLINKNLGAG